MVQEKKGVLGLNFENEEPSASQWGSTDVCEELDAALSSAHARMHGHICVTQRQMV